MPSSRADLIRKREPRACLRDCRASRGELPLSLALRHSGPIELKLAYELVGSQAGPLLIVAGGISAGRHVVASLDYPEDGWWQQQSLSFNLDECRVLSFDWIGADGTLDAPIDPADQADALAKLMSLLELPRAAAFIGASYGAMVGMHVAARHPGLIGGLLAISAAARAHPFSSACRALQRQALGLGELAGLPDAGVALARAMAMLTYRTPSEFAERFHAVPLIQDGRVRVAAEDYLDAHGARHSRRMSSLAYRRLSESIDLHDVDPGMIRPPLALVAVDEDALVPASDVRALADAVPGATFQIINSRFGHDAFLKEEDAVARTITAFVKSLEFVA